MLETAKMPKTHETLENSRSESLPSFYTKPLLSSSPPWKRVVRLDGPLRGLKGLLVRLEERETRLEGQLARLEDLLARLESLKHAP